MTNIEIFDCGIIVHTKLSNIEAIITAVTIRFGRVLYELSYFKDGDYKTAWVDKSEFVISEPSQSIGFKVSLNNAPRC